VGVLAAFNTFNGSTSRLFIENGAAFLPEVTRSIGFQDELSFQREHPCSFPVGELLPPA